MNSRPFDSRFTVPHSRFRIRDSGGWMRRACVTLAAMAMLVGASTHLWADRAPQASAPPLQPSHAPAPTAATGTTQRELVQKYCLTCHNERAKTGGLVLEGLDPADTAAHAEVWEKVVRKVRGGMMPPQG